MTPEAITADPPGHSHAATPSPQTPPLGTAPPCPASHHTDAPRHAARGLAFFHKACLIDHQDACGIAHRVGYERMVRPPHRFLLPGHVTEKPLPPADGAPLDMEGHRLDR